MKRQERRRAKGDGDLSDAFWTEEERPESAEQPVTPPQVRRDNWQFETHRLRQDKGRGRRTRQQRPLLLRGTCRWPS